MIIWLNQIPAKGDNDFALLLRCVQLGISIRDIDLLTIGVFNDMSVESHNDEYNYPAVATQEQMDRF